MGTSKHSELSGINLHRELVDDEGTTKIDTKTTGSDAVVKFLSSNIKKITYNATDNTIDFYVNDADVGFRVLGTSVRFPSQSAAPSNPAGGEVYYDTDDDKLKVYNAGTSSWDNLN